MGLKIDEFKTHQKCQTKGKRGNVALKIYINKAYDRINWGNLEAIMRRLGFHSHFITMIMLCVTTVQYHITVNGDLVDLITPQVWPQIGRPFITISIHYLCKGTVRVD